MSLARVLPRGGARSRASPSPRTVSPSRRTVALLAAALTAHLAGGCATPIRPPDLGGLYDRAARDRHPDRNPVVLVPGLLGSRLRDSRTGRIVWGVFDGESADPGTLEGARLVALPMREGARLDELRDEVAPDGVLDRVRVRFFGLPASATAYAYLLAALGLGGYRDELLGLSGAVDYGDDHFTCFQFDYDWRRDLVENARRFHAFLLEKREYVRRETRRRFGRADPDVRFDAVAHSMGGLLLRYFLLYGEADLPADGSLPAVTWAGSRLVERAILVGPPNAGSADALLDLVRGVKFGPFLPRYEPAVLGSFPSIYQLLPRARHGALVEAEDEARRVEDFLSVDRWQRMGWGLASPDQDRVLQILLPEIQDRRTRRRIALDHLRKCLERADRIGRALDEPALPPEGLEIDLIAGDAVPTAKTLALDRADGGLRVVERGPGDGTVLRSSALLDERVGGRWAPRLVSPIRWARVTFLPSDHRGLTREPAFLDNLLFLLLEDPRGRTLSSPRTATAADS